MDHLCYLCLVFVMLPRLFVAALWSLAGKGLTSWLLCVMSNCDFVTFPYGILGQVRYLIVLIPDIFHLSYLHLCIFDSSIRGTNLIKINENQVSMNRKSHTHRSQTNQWHMYVSSIQYKRYKSDKINEKSIECD